MRQDQKKKIYLEAFINIYVNLLYALNSHNSFYIHLIHIIHPLTFLSVEMTKKGVKFSYHQTYWIF
jgi:hypothetical protein